MRRRYETAALRFSFCANALHYALNQLFRFANLGGDDANVHHRYSCIAIAVAIDAVLADEHKRVGQKVERDGQAAAVRTHHRFVVFQFFAMLVKSRHECFLGCCAKISAKAARLRNETIAYATDRQEVPRFRGVVLDVASQADDEIIDCAGIGVFVQAPHIF